MDISKRLEDFDDDSFEIELMEYFNKSKNESKPLNVISLLPEIAPMHTAPTVHPSTSRNSLEEVGPKRSRLPSPRKMDEEHSSVKRLKVENDPAVRNDGEEVDNDDWLMDISWIEEYWDGNPEPPQQDYRQEKTQKEQDKESVDKMEVDDDVFDNDMDTGDRDSLTFRDVSNTSPFLFERASFKADEGVRSISPSDRLMFLKALFHGIEDIPSIISTISSIRHPEDSHLMFNLFLRKRKDVYLHEILEEIEVDEKYIGFEYEPTLLADFMRSLNNTGIREGLQRLSTFTRKKNPVPQMTSVDEEEACSIVFEVSLLPGAVDTLIRALQRTTSEYGSVIDSPSHLWIHIDRSDADDIGEATQSGRERSFLVHPWERFPFMKYIGHPETHITMLPPPNFYNLGMVICREPSTHTYSTFVGINGGWIRVFPTEGLNLEREYYSNKDVRENFARNSIILLYISDRLQESETVLKLGRLGDTEEKCLKLNVEEENLLPFLLKGEDIRLVDRGDSFIQPHTIDPFGKNKAIWDLTALHLYSLLINATPVDTADQIVLSEQQSQQLEIAVAAKTSRCNIQIPNTSAVVFFCKYTACIKVSVDHPKFPPTSICRVCLQPSEIATHDYGKLKKHYCNLHMHGRVKFVVGLLLFSNGSYFPRLLPFDRKESNYRKYFINRSVLRGFRGLLGSLDYHLVDAGFKIFENFKEAEQWLGVLKVASFLHHSVFLGKRSDYLIQRGDIPQSLTTSTQQDMELLMEDALRLLSMSLSVNREKVSEAIQHLLNSDEESIRKFVCRPKLNRKTPPGSKFKSTYSLVFQNIECGVNGYLPGRNSHGEKVCSDHVRRIPTFQINDLYLRNMWPHVQVNMFTISETMLEVLESSLQMVYFLASCLGLYHVVDNTKVRLLNRVLEYIYTLPLGTNYIDYLNLFAATELHSEFQFQKLNKVQSTIRN